MGRLVGALAQHQVIELVRSATVFAAPCVVGSDGNRDGLPTVLLEAMAAGRPLVVSDLPGYRSVARDGAQGRLVTPGDPRALADAIASLLDNPSLRRAMGEEGRRTVAEYDWPVVARRLRNVYVEVCV